ncbi:Na+/H+ antiporter subunit E [Acinetobacter puyangensis]|uniref:Na+/H+ antiporter subunit E n=1 Tax=Acinetobacter puyangensis TaxID=1096779 RepID=UPI003A4D82E7
MRKLFSTNHFIFRIFPHPLVSFILAASWIMLQHSFSGGNIVLAILLGWSIPKMMQGFVVRTPDINWLEAIKLFFVVLWDVIISNIRVARLVLGSSDKLHPKWFRVPLDTNHDQVNSLLAMIITTTPGTISAGIDQQRGDILVHSLSTDNEQADIDDIKQRYEQPLIRVFHAQDQQNQENVS